MKRYASNAAKLVFLGFVAMHATAAADNLYDNNYDRGAVDTFNKLRNDPRTRDEKCSMGARASDLGQAWWSGTRSFVDWYKLDQPWYALIAAGALPYIGIATAHGANRAHNRYCAMANPPGPTPDHAPEDDKHVPATPDVRDGFEYRTLPRDPRERFNI